MFTVNLINNKKSNINVVMIRLIDSLLICKLLN